MAGRGRQRAGALAAALALLAGLACEPYPRDPEGTFERASGGVLRVGGADAPPWIVRGAGGSASGPEAALIEAFAASIDARVEWRWGPVEEHLESLQKYELDLVAGGLLGNSPWSTHVGFTRPWLQEGDSRRVIAVAPGENRTLAALERVIEARKAAP